VGEPGRSAGDASRTAAYGQLVRGLALLAATSAALVLAAGALADTAAVPATASLPWSDPAHQTPLELLAGQIASHVAGRPVSVRCEGDGDWAALVDSPGVEQGYVGSAWNGATGQLVSVSGTIELAGSTVCLPLQRFAAAAAKPTKCAAPFAPPRRRASRRTTLRTARAPGLVPCYLGAGRAVAPMPRAWWSAYEGYATAMLVLAHESVHAGGIVGGQLASGLAVGDPQAEAKADCFGMQWIPYVAQRLGDTADDAQALAIYVWDTVYPRMRTAAPQYWSGDCRPGGPLDLEPPGAAWP
jgi:hypothetical protein